MKDFARMLAEGYAEARAFSERKSLTRLVYLAEHIFDFTTYDDAMSDLFAGMAIEVCAAINERKTFEYIEDRERYRWYLLLCNMPFFADRLEWGTSIRGAWWQHEIEFDSCGLWLDGKQVTDTLKLNAEQWHAFVSAMIEFSKLGEEVEP